MDFKKLLAATAFMVAGSANAALIDGSIEIGAAWKPVDSSNTPVTNILLATGIDFSLNTGVVFDAIGDFTSVPLYSTATMTDFQFTPFTPPVNVWSVGGFTFTLNTVSVTTQTTNDLDLQGTGTVSGNGFNVTSGNWFFSGQTANGKTFSWSSSTATVVPVPAAVWLFGSGLLGLIGIARRKSV